MMGWKTEILALTVLVVLCTILGYQLSEIGFFERIELKSNNNYSNITNCKNLSLEDTAYCLNNFVKSIFIYNITKDGSKLTLEELKTRGGDCENWANLYKKMAKDLNYIATTTNFRTDYKKAHVIAIISDSTGYCIMDQQTYDCYYLK